MASSCDVERDLGQMPTSFERPGVQCGALDTPNATSREVFAGDRVAGPRLIARSLRRRRLTGADLLWRAAGQRRMRSDGVVPLSKNGKLHIDLTTTKRHQDAASSFVLEGQKKSLDDGDGSLSADGAEADFDVMFFEPGTQGTRWLRSFGIEKLRALVGDQMSRSSAGVSDRGIECFHNLIGSDARTETANTQNLPRKRIDDSDDASCFRKDPRNACGPPGKEGAPIGGDACDIAMPNMPRIAGEGLSRSGFLFEEILKGRLGPVGLFGSSEKAEYGRRSKHQPGASQELRNFAMPEMRKGPFEREYNQAHIVGEFVDRRSRPFDERCVFEFAMPFGDGAIAELKFASGSRMRPASRHLHLQDGEPFVVSVMTEAGASGASVLNPQLCFEEPSMRLDSLKLDLVAIKRMCTLVPEAVEIDRGSVRECNDSQKAALEMKVPIAGERNVAGGNVRHCDGFVRHDTDCVRVSSRPVNLEDL